MAGQLRIVAVLARQSDRFASPFAPIHVTEEPGKQMEHDLAVFYSITDVIRKFINRKDVKFRGLDRLQERGKAILKKDAVAHLAET